MTSEEKSGITIAARVVTTGVVVAAWGVFNLVSNKAAPVLYGELAVRQLENSNLDNVYSQVAMTFFTGHGLSALLLLVVLGIIWWRPFRGIFTKAMVLAVMTLALSGGSPANAYYETVDNPEWVEIQPNQTAFLIPMVGANKTSQAAFMSEAYLQENKVAMKRVQIPHVLIKNSTWARDYYIPAAKLIIVDRSPFMREWVAATNRGTSNRDESFRFESAESVNISTGIVVAAFVKEEDAAKFLYWFGNRAEKGNPSDPHVMYASVVYGKSLAEVMDTVVRGKIQAIIAREFGKLSTDDGIRKKAEIIQTVDKETKETFLTKGITVEYVGYAESLTLSPKVQEAIDRAYMAQKSALAADAQAKSVPVLEQLADIEVKKGLAAAAYKWNGQLPALPSFMVLPPDIVNSMTNWFKPDQPSKK